MKKPNTSKKLNDGETILCIDESPYRLVPVTRERWAKKETYPTISPVQSDWRKVSAIGAIAFRLDEIDSLETRTFFRLHAEIFSVGSVNGCIVQFERDDRDEIVRGEPVCRPALHHSLPFEPDSFSGNLKQRVKEVCSECWETYVNHQWNSDDQGDELCVEVWEENGRPEYFAASVETDQGGHEAVLRLVSENGLEKLSNAKTSCQSH